MAANLFIGVNRGQNLNQVVSNTSTNSTDIEVAIDTSKLANREDALLLLEQIEAKLTQLAYP